jgi:hypothetical protein
MSPAMLSVYDVAGRLIWRRDFGTCRPGFKRAVWACKDSSGEDIGVGMYFVRLSDGTQISTGKVVILK